MKPSNWNEMTDIEKHDDALLLMRSMRGALIMSQALVRAIEVMSAEPVERREVSNIQDMEVLLELFPIFKMVAESNKQFAELAKTNPAVMKVLNAGKKKGK